MKTHTFARIAGLAGVSLVLGLSGCATTNADASASATEPAVLCPTCETVWVRQQRQINKTTFYTTEKKMACPGCTSAVETFFKTGKLQHTCATCGGNLAPCKAH